MATSKDMTRSEVTKFIKQQLKARTGRDWSVTGDRGTAWGWLRIEAAKARRVNHESNPEYDALPWDEAHAPWQTIPAYFEVAPPAGETGWYSSDEDRQILAEALGIGMNQSGHQGVSISPDMWDFYMDRAENGKPEPEPEPEYEVPAYMLEPTPDAPTDVEVEEVTGDLFAEVKWPRLNKNQYIQEYTEQLDDPDDYHLIRAKVTHIARLTDAQYDALVNGNLMTDLDWVAGLGGCGSTADLRDVDEWWQYTEEEQEAWQAESYNLAIKVTAPHRDTIYIDPQGHRYARYVGFPVNQEDDLLEAVDELAEVLAEPEAKPDDAIITNMARAFLQTKPINEVLNILKGAGVDNDRATRIMTTALGDFVSAL